MNPLAMQLLQSQLNGGCCGSALLGGAMLGGGRGDPKPTVFQPHEVKVSSKVQQNLALAQQGQDIGKMPALRYLKLHNPEARAKAQATKQANKAAANMLYNKRLESGDPMSRLEFCMTKCKISDDSRKARGGGKLPASVKENASYRAAKSKVRLAKESLAKAIADERDGATIKAMKAQVLAQEANKRTVAKSLMGL